MKKLFYILLVLSACLCKANAQAPSTLRGTFLDANILVGTNYLGAEKLRFHFSTRNNNGVILINGRRARGFSYYYTPLNSEIGSLEIDLFFPLLSLKGRIYFSSNKSGQIALLGRVNPAIQIFGTFTK